MIAVMVASVVLVVTTILILYETLRLTSNHLAELPLRPAPGSSWRREREREREREGGGLGGFAGLPVEGFQDCLYFSVVTYTSLGFGDQIPTSHARLIAGVEALNGLLLIGWSA